MYTLSIGVNNGLRYAEYDATRICRYFMESALAPPTAGGRLLLGDHATRATVEAALISMGRRRFSLSSLMIYFAGHGEPDGIWLADDLLPYVDLAALLAAAHVPRILLLLDTCHSGASAAVIGADKVASSTRDYLAAIVRSVPGCRILASSRATQSSLESLGVGGHFTAAILEALESAPSDLFPGGNAFVSERQVFIGAWNTLTHALGSQQSPIAKGLRGDFPLAYGQDRTLVGAAQIAAIELMGGTAVTATVVFNGRRHVPCTARLILMNQQGRVLAVGDHESQTIRPDKDCQSGTIYRHAHPLSLQHAAELRLHRSLGTPLRWRFEILDVYEDVIAAREIWGTMPAAYRRAA